MRVHPAAPARGCPAWREAARGECGLSYAPGASSSARRAPPGGHLEIRGEAQVRSGRWRGPFILFHPGSVH